MAWPSAVSIHAKILSAVRIGVARAARLFATSVWRSTLELNVRCGLVGDAALWRRALGVRETDVCRSRLARRDVCISAARRHRNGIANKRSVGRAVVWSTARCAAGTVDAEVIRAIGVRGALVADIAGTNIWTTGRGWWVRRCVHDADFGCRAIAVSQAWRGLWNTEIQRRRSTTVEWQLAFLACEPCWALGLGCAWIGANTVEANTTGANVTGCTCIASLTATIRIAADAFARRGIDHANFRICTICIRIARCVGVIRIVEIVEIVEVIEVIRVVRIVGVVRIVRAVVAAIERVARRVVRTSNCEKHYKCRQKVCESAHFYNPKSLGPNGPILRPNQ